MTVTDEQIRALGDEFHRAENHERVNLCYRALNGDTAARNECAWILQQQDDLRRAQGFPPAKSDPYGCCDGSVPCPQCDPEGRHPGTPRPSEEVTRPMPRIPERFDVTNIDAHWFKARPQTWSVRIDWTHPAKGPLRTFVHTHYDHLLEAHACFPLAVVMAGISRGIDPGRSVSTAPTPRGT